jgi:hypothetical protein
MSEEEKQRKVEEVELALGARLMSSSQSVGGFGFEKPVEGNTNDWLTPPKLLKKLGTFDLDPCGCPGMPWSTATTIYFPPEQDGLNRTVARKSVLQSAIRPSSWGLGKANGCPR